MELWVGFFSTVEGLQKFIEGTVKILVGASLLIDLGNGMHDGGVVLASELPPDLRERSFGHLLGQIHGDLAGDDHGARVIFLLQLRYTHAELFRNGTLNGFDGDLAHLGIDELLEADLGGREGELGAIKPAPGQ
jgi:hypothetical protein